MRKAGAESQTGNMVRTLGQIALTGFLVFLSLAVLEFVDHAYRLGWSGLGGGEVGTRLFSDVLSANLGLYTHMLSGAVITVFAPLQLIPLLRQKLPALHRWSGRLLVSLAIITAIGGLIYIPLNGTVGDWPMDIAFALYGTLMLLSAVQTIRSARARRWLDHRDWALRLFLLAIGSWLYRVHYYVWVPLTDRAGVTGLDAGMTGWFDRINIWAFYLPYLLVLELVLWRQGRGLFAARRGRVFRNTAL